MGSVERRRRGLRLRNNVFGMRVCQTLQPLKEAQDGQFGLTFYRL